MARSKSPQRDKESLFLCGLEVGLRDALKKTASDREGETNTNRTYVVQNLNAQFRIFVFQT